MNNLKDIHNYSSMSVLCWFVVLSGFQWTIWRIYTTESPTADIQLPLFYQDFNEQFEGYTQPKAREWTRVPGCFIRISMNNLKDIHNFRLIEAILFPLFYQDFNEQFEGYTQRLRFCLLECMRCFIRISMNNLKDIHN